MPFEERRHMEYQDFLCAVKEELNSRFDKGTEAKIYGAVKNNGLIRKGVVIESADSNIAPVIYLEEFFKRHKKGLPLGQAAKEVMDFYRSVKVDGDRDTSVLKDFAAVKGRIVFKLINYMKNEEMLSYVPHIRVMDLAAVFCVLLSRSAGGTVSAAVRSEHLMFWGTDTNELYELALHNARKLLPPRFYSMNKAIQELSGEVGEEYGETAINPEEDMYVLTNTCKSFGAACMVYPHVLETVGDILGEDFYILPSSIHELIIVPSSKIMAPEALDGIIDEINETQVEPDEVLSGHCYHYGREGKELDFSR